MTENNRSFGQGAKGEPDAPIAKKVSFLTRLRYNFDNSIAKSGAFVAYMFGGLVIMSILVVFIKYALYAVPFLYSGDKLPTPTFETFWGSFAGLLGKGGEATWADRILGIIEGDSEPQDFIPELLALDAVDAKLGDEIAPDLGHDLIGVEKP